jgi:hypothetical protein
MNIQVCFPSAFVIGPGSVPPDRIRRQSRRQACSGADHVDQGSILGAARIVRSSDSTSVAACPIRRIPPVRDAEDVPILGRNRFSHQARLASLVCNLAISWLYGCAWPTLCDVNSCPHCGSTQTLVCGGRTNLCLKCHYRWGVDPGAVAVEETLAGFDADQQRRLVVFRRAVAVGFYRESV